MAKLTLNDVNPSGSNTTNATTINNNSAAIETALENTLSRDGTSPNQMNANFDMNSNRILNLPHFVSADEPLRAQELSDFIGGGTVTNIPPGGSTNDVLVKTSNTDYAVGWSHESAEVLAGTNIATTGTSPVTVSVVTAPTFTGTVTGSASNSFAGNSVLFTNIAAPATPASGKTIAYTDSSSKNLNIKNDLGTVTTMVAPDAGATNQYLTSINANGVIGKSQPTIGNILPFTSASLATAVTDETGSGSLVFATTPTLVTPVLGVATATSINKVAFTPPATAATLAIANNKTLTANNSLTLAGTDATTITFQGTDTYVGRDTTDTLTHKTFDTASTGNILGVAGVGITANTGTGGTIVRDTSPTLITPALGTPTALVASAGITGTAINLTAGTATNAVNSGITDDTTTNATMNLAWVTSNSGNLPVKTTSTKLNFNPSTGSLSSTKFNGNTLTAGSYTLTGTAAKTLTFNNSLTLAGTDATTMTFPTTTATIARTDAAQTFTGIQTFTSPSITTPTGIAATDIASIGAVRYKVNVNFNVGAADTALPIALPTGITRYYINEIAISNSTGTLTTATVGVFSAAGGTGTTIAANQAITVTNGTVNTANNMQLLTGASFTTAYNFSSLQVRVGTAQGSATTADVTITIIPLG